MRILSSLDMDEANVATAQIQTTERAADCAHGLLPG
jgi:hypothetical protein